MEISTSSTSEGSPRILVRYGDILQVYAESNPTLHEKSFLVDYVDEDKLRLVATSTPSGESPTTVVLAIDPETHTFVDRTIERIELVTRADKPGVARQLGLVPGQWVEMRFLDIDTPLVGKVTHLEEDQIEFMTLPRTDPDGTAAHGAEVLYIDFGYRGIPEDLPIREFVLIPAPDHGPEIVLAASDVEGVHLEGDEDAPSSAASMEYSPDNEMIIQLPDDSSQIRYDVDPREELHHLYLDANDIQFGETEVHEETVQVQEKVYSLETQLHDFMDELLSIIPTAQRTPDVFEGVHRLLERFKELREAHSLKDAYGNIRSYVVRGPDHKPLVEPLSTLSRAVPWILPVVHARRKLQTEGNEGKEGSGEPEDEGVPDVELLDTTGEVATELADLVNQYFKAQIPGDMNKYHYMLQETDRLLNPLSTLPLTGTDAVLLADRQPVRTEMETVLDHFAADPIHHFYATTYDEVVAGSDVITKTQVRRFAAQRFVTGTTVMTGVAGLRRQFARTELTPSDPMTVHGWLMMPYPVVQYSRVRLPQTTLLERAALAQRPWLFFRALSASAERRVIDTLIVDDFDANLYEGDGAAADATFLDRTQRIVLSSDLEHTPEPMKQTVQSMIPSTLDLIQLVHPRLPVHRGVSMHDLLAHLEPFLVYASDLTFPQYQRMRQVVKDRMSAYQQEMTRRKQQYETLRQFFVKQSSRSESEPNPIKTILENAPIYEMSVDGYAAAPFGATNPFLGMQVLDGGALFANLVRTLLVSLVIPASMMTAQVAPVDMDVEPVPLGSDCARKFLAKRYTTLADLQKDNCTDIYFDKDLDDTPYKLLDSYKESVPKKDASEPERQEFVEFLAVNLIQKHACPSRQARALATDLLLGKKRVRAGEYATLTLAGEAVPVFYRRMESSSSNESSSSSEDPETCPPSGTMEIWIKDDQVTEESFVAPHVLAKTAFPDLCIAQQRGAPCFKNSVTRTCDTVEEARQSRDTSMSFKDSKETSAALQEFEKRLHQSLQDTEDTLERERQQLVHQLTVNASLDHMQMYRANVLAHTLGKFAVPPTGLVSPHVALCRAVLATPDFVQRQYDVVRLVEESGKLRTPMTEQMSENPYWFYCTDTNTPLLPTFLYTLALAYARGGSEAYQTQLAEVTRARGTMSDDGDAWVDRHSGYVITRIEMVREDEYDESGFKIQSKVLEPVEGVEDPESVDQVNRVVDDETTALVRVVYRAYDDVMALRRDDVQERVMRMSVEVVRDTLKSSATFAQEQAKSKKKLSDLQMDDLYKKYRNQYVIIIVTCLLLMCLQTASPPLSKPKTVPGCVRSLAGYPLSEDPDDVRSIRYMACILNHIKSASIVPWNAIQGIKREKIQELMRTMVQTILDQRHDLQEVFLVLRSEGASAADAEIPEEVALVRWRGFLPPLVAYSAPTLTPPAKTLLDELARGDAHTLHRNVLVVQSKIIQYAYGIIHAIHQTVRLDRGSIRDALLKTTLGIPFVQNACCNDQPHRITLDYFVQDTPALGAYVTQIRLLERVLDRARGVPSTMIHVAPATSGVRSQVSANPEENIYHAFIHYCLFDRPHVDIPDHLRGVCPSKPRSDTYAQSESLAEKIAVLKSMGRKYTPQDLETLMKAVNGRRRVDIHSMTPIQPTVTSLLVELLSSMDDRHEALHLWRPKTPHVLGKDSVPESFALRSPVLDADLRGHLLDVLAEYKPLVLHSTTTGEDASDTANSYQEAVNRLKNYLYKSNGAMTTHLVAFFQMYGGVSKPELKRLHKGIQEMGANAGAGTGADTIQRIKTSILFLTKVLPDQIIHRRTAPAAVPKHWDLSEEHQARLQELDERYRSPFQKFKEESVSKLTPILRQVPASLSDLTVLMNLLPVTVPLEKDGQTWYRWLDPQTTQWLFHHLWLSVYSQYVKNSGNGNLPQDVAALLLGCLRTDMENQVQIQQDYVTVMKKVNRAKDREKEGIMNRFRDADKGTRATMFLEKKWKLGRWNVSLDGLVRYNKTTFDAELLDMMDDVDEDADEDQEVGLEDDANDAEAHEGNDFGELGPDYADGDYYGEDDADDFGED